MLTVFEAAETGNKKLLVELVAEGADIQQASSNGNTPLMLASYSGHFEIVEWLVRYAKARTAEQNASGNTALSLACAYGKPDIVKFLLQEQGIEALTQKNARGATPLLIAAQHQQLTVFDFLIRNYYLTTPLTEEAKKELGAFPKDSVFQYYLAVLDNFSKETLNLKKLASLLHKAETYLNTEELSYVYLIYFWMLVTKKTRHSELACKTGTIAINRVPLNHQTELLTYMFKAGYLIIDSFIRDGQLQISSFDILAHRGRIENLLAGHVRDANWIAASEAEKSELFRKYYVVPLYCNLVSSYFTGTLEEALTHPFGYSGTDIYDAYTADWAAYHLSLKTDVIPQDFLNVFARMRGPSRKIFFETVKQYLTEHNRSKVTILDALEHAPDKDGARLLWSREYPRWLASLYGNLGTLNPTDATLTLIGLSRSISLAESFSGQIWDIQQHRLQNSQFPGNHPVYKITLPEQQSIYCKLYPGLPGINDAVQLLYRRLFCATGGLPWSVTGLLEIDSQVIPVLISQDGGELIKPNDPSLDLLDKTTLTKLILFTILTNPEDAKTGNFALQKNASGQYELCSFDNDQSFVGAMTETGVFFKSQKIRLKSFLFCLDAMKDALDDSVVKEFLSLEPLLCLESWLQDLCLLETQYENLFKHCKTRARDEKDLLRRSYLGMVLPAATLMTLAYKMQRLQHKLRENPKASGIELLSSVEPKAGQFYGLILQQPLSPTERFEKLAKDYALYKWCSKTSQYSTTLTSCKEIFEGLVPDNQAELVTPRDALAIFQRATQQWQVLAQEQVQFTTGNVQSLFSLPLDEQQRLLKFTRLNQFTASEREKLFDALGDKKDFKHLHIEYPHTSLTLKILAKILKSNAELESLSIRRAAALTSMPPLGHLKSLTKLALRELSLKTLVIEENSGITELVLKSNTDLISVSIKAPHLRRLTIIDCPKLEKLELPFSKDLHDVLIEGCLNLPLGKFFQDWPGFISQWHGLPSELQGDLAVFITTYFKERDKEPKQSVYEAVKAYLDHIHFLYQNIPDIKTPNEAGLAFRFLDLDYMRFVKAKDYVRVIFDGSVFDAVAEVVRTFQIRELVVEQILLINQGFSLGETQHELLHNLNELIKRISQGLLALISGLLETDRTISDYRAFFADLLNQMNALHQAVTQRLFEIVLESDAKPSNPGNSLYDQMPAMQREIRFVVRALFIEKVCRIQVNEAWIIEYIVKILSNNLDYSPEYRSVVIGACKHLRFRYEKLCEVLQELSESGDEHIRIVAKQTLEQQQRLKSNEANLQNFVEESSSSSGVLTHAGSKNAFNEALKVVDNFTSPHRLLQTIQNLTELGDDKAMRSISVMALVVCKIQPREVLEPTFDELFADKHETEDAISPEYESESSPSESSSSSSFPMPSMVIGSDANPIVIPQASIMDAALNGNLVEFKKQCEGKNGKKLATFKNSDGETPLSFAARRGHFFVVDYLIRYHYHDFSFTNLEMQAIAAMRANPEYQPYVRLIEFFSSPLVKSEEVVNTLRQAATQCTADMLSSTYLLYLWREVHMKARPNKCAYEPKTYPIPMQSLLAEHQLEMIDHMIREGHALKGWFINSEKLSISNMTVDKKQVQVMRRLLEQGQYQWRLLSQNTRIEEGMIYLRLHDNSLYYALYDRQGCLQSGVIPEEIIGHRLTAPLTLEQIPAKERFLAYIAKHCDTRPALQSLIVQGVRFTKTYRFRAKEHQQFVFPNMLYFTELNGCIQYTVLSPSGKVVSDTFDKDVLKKLGWAPPQNDLRLAKSLDASIRGILAITAMRGHTYPASQTHGFKEFVELLGSNLCLPSLQDLHLDDCDLFDDFDISALMRILGQSRSLIRISLDKNHVTANGLIYILEALRPHGTLRVLSLRDNEIDICFDDHLESINRSLNLIQNIFVSGNRISYASSHQKSLSAHAARINILRLFFAILSNQAICLSVARFLSTRDIQLSQKENGDFWMILGFVDNTEIKILLTMAEREMFFGLSQNIIQESRGFQSLEPMFQEIFLDVIREIRPRMMSKSLLDAQVTGDLVLCKSILYHHAQAPLKGRLLSHSVFRTQEILSAPSFLFSGMQLTSAPNRQGLGMVYLLANKVGVFDLNEHALLGYEYLTSYGQHVFKIAHLTVTDNGKIKIGFIGSDSNVLSSYVKHSFLIAPFCTSSHLIKEMHRSILLDIDNPRLSTTKYQTVISGSSRENGVLNCLIYCLDKIAGQLQLNIPMGRVDCRPSSIVKRYFENFKLAELGLLGAEHNSSNKDCGV